MPTLSSYVAKTRDFLNDPNALFWTTAQIQDYVNRARNRVAMDAQCIRILPPSTGSISTAVATNVGSGYTAPTVSVNVPDGPVGGVQAVLTANVVGGQITSYTITTAGTGYVAPPVVTITDSTGVNAVCTATLTDLISTITGQETYKVSSFTAAAKVADNGVQSVIGIQSISVSWGSLTPTLDQTDWTTFQSSYRAYNIGSENYPSLWSMYGRGQGGTCYLWPIPAGYNAMQVDCYCIPIDLLTDATTDSVPVPFSDCVPYYAAYLAYANAQRKDDSEYYKQLYTERMIASGAFTTPSWAPSAY